MPIPNYQSPEQLRQQFPNQEIYQAPSGNQNNTPPAAVNPPPPPPAPTGNNQLIVTGNSYGNQVNNAQSQLTQMLQQYGLSDVPSTETPEKKIDVTTYSDPYTKLLDSMSSKSNAATKALIESIKAKKLTRENALKSDYQNYERGLQLLGIQTGKAQFSPDLMQGQITQVEAEKQMKLQDLDAEETKAIMDAQNAQEKGDFETLKEKMDYVQKVKDEKANALKELYDTMSTQTKIADIQAHTIYDQLKKLNESDKHTFLEAVAKKYGIPLPTLVQSLADEQTARQKASKGKELSDSDLKKNAYDNLNEIVSGTNIGGENTIDKNGFLTPNAFKAMIIYGKKYGVSKQDILDTYGGYLYLNEGGYQKYGLSKADYKKLTGALPEEDVPVE